MKCARKKPSAWPRAGQALLGVPLSTQQSAANLRDSVVQKVAEATMMRAYMGGARATLRASANGASPGG